VTVLERVAVEGPDAVCVTVCDADAWPPAMRSRSSWDSSIIFSISTPLFQRDAEQFRKSSPVPVPRLEHINHRKARNATLKIVNFLTRHEPLASATIPPKGRPRTSAPGQDGRNERRGQLFYLIVLECDTVLSSSLCRLAGQTSVPPPCAANTSSPAGAQGQRAALERALQAAVKEKSIGIMPVSCG
jgi:hypothetical protein